MPKNIAGKEYDLRPYIDELGWLVVRRGPNTGRFRLQERKLVYRLSGHYHIDRYDLEMMKKQARTLIPLLTKGGE